MLDTLFATRIAISDAPGSPISLALAGASLAVAAGAFVALRAARARSRTRRRAPSEHGWALVLTIDAIMILVTAAVLLVL